MKVGSSCHCCQHSAAQREALGKGDEGCELQRWWHGSSNPLFYCSSRCGPILATPPWWEQSGLQALPCSWQWLQPRQLS